MGFTNHQIQQPKKKRTLRIFLAGLVGFLAVNVVAAIAVKSVLSRQDADADTDGGETSQSEESAGDIARIHRIAGLEAMERQDYTMAIREMTAAARAGDDSPELLRLISLAQQLRGPLANAPVAPADPTAAAANPTGAAPVASPPAPQPAPSAAAAEEVSQLLARARANTPRRPTRRRTRVAQARPEPAVVETPEEAPQEAAIAPSRPDPSPFEPETPPPAEEPTPAPIVPPRPTVSSSATPPPARAPVRTPTPRPAPRAAQAVGSLEVSSPNVYGDVYVNGRAYGPAPRVVRGIPVGAARVEIRVDGDARRSRTVRVREGARTPVRIY